MSSLSKRISKNIYEDLQNKPTRIICNKELFDCLRENKKQLYDDYGITISNIEGD